MINLPEGFRIIPTELLEQVDAAGTALILSEECGCPTINPAVRGEDHIAGEDYPEDCDACGGVECPWRYFRDALISLAAYGKGGG